MKLSNLFNILFLNAFLFIFVSCETPVEEIETDRNALSATDSSEAVISKSEEQPSAKEVDEININDLAESELPKCSENFPEQALVNNGVANGFNLRHAYGELPIDESSFPRTIFNDVEGLHGQGLVGTEVLSFSEDKLIQMWTTGPNARILKNYQSGPVSIIHPNNDQDTLYFYNTARGESSESIQPKSAGGGISSPSNCYNTYYATTYLKAGESISFSILNSMYGNRVNAAVIAVDGVHYLFKAHSKDYSLSGGHNLASYFSKGFSRVNGRVKTYQCSGNVIETRRAKNFGCKDHAQKNYGIKCFEEDYTQANGDGMCRFYDGAIERGPDSADYIHNINIGYFMEQESYFKDQVLQ